MATKRHLKAIPGAPATPKEQEEEGLGRWAKRMLVKYWYLLVCAFADSFVALEIARHTELGFEIGLAMIVLLALILSEAFVFWKLWGPDGRWNFDEDDEC